MNKVEQLKKEKDGLDVWNDVLRYAKTGFESIEEGDFVRMRWYGIYQQRPNEGHFMMRIKLPGGQATSAQLKVIAELTDRYARGIADVTTRQTFQWHWLTVADLPPIIDALASVGITTAGACGDIARNVVGCPVAGFHKDEILDVRPCHFRHSFGHMAGNREFSNLPRKFKLSVSADPEQCCQPEIHDFSLVGVRDQANGRTGFWPSAWAAACPPSPTSERGLTRFSRPTKPWTPAGPLRVFSATTATAKNAPMPALKYLVADWGADRFKDELIKYLGYTPRPGAPDTAPDNVYRDHVGVHPQKQAGLNWVGLTILTGRVTGGQLKRLAEIADEFGGGEVRCSHMQNILLPNIPDAHVENALAALKDAGFQWEGHSVRRGAIACTGTEFCNLAITETKGRMIQIVTHLENRVPFERNLRINMNGCPNGCAQHAVGDIGLQGCKIRGADGSQTEAYDIHLGGATGKNRSFTHAIHRKVPAENVQYALENLLHAFNRTHQPGEEFGQWTKRHDDATLDGFLGVHTIVGDPDQREFHDDTAAQHAAPVTA